MQVASSDHGGRVVTLAFSPPCWSREELDYGHNWEGRKTLWPAEDWRSQKRQPNEATLAVGEKLDALGCDPTEGMAKIAMDKKNSAEARGRSVTTTLKELVKQLRTQLSTSILSGVFRQQHISSLQALATISVTLRRLEKSGRVKATCEGRKVTHKMDWRNSWMNSEDVYRGRTRRSCIGANG